MELIDLETGTAPLRRVKKFVASLVICTLTTGVALLFYRLGVEKENMTLVMLVGVLLSTAVTGGFGYGFFAAVFCALSFNYFFTAPMYAFVMTEKQDVWMTFFFLIGAFICGVVSARIRRRAEIAHFNEMTAQMIYSVTEHFLNKNGVAEIVESAVNYIAGLTGYDCCVLLEAGKFPDEQREYASKPGLDISRAFSLPIRGLTEQIGAIYFTAATFHNDRFDVDKFIHVVVYQMALVLDREAMVMAQEKMRMTVEGERLKTTLLRSVSHDIRTPLTAIAGASSTILDNYDSLDSSSVRELVADIREESSWLNLTVQNILDLTRFNAGELILSREFEAVEELMDQAVSRSHSFTSERRVRVIYPPEILMIKVDGRLFVQVLLNLLDNAYKHAGADAQVELEAYRSGTQVLIEVRDNGAGIDPEIRPRIFVSFTTMARHSADKGRGVGLGLAICKAIVEAHGGEITAENRPEGGALFRIKIPLEEE